MRMWGGIGAALLCWGLAAGCHQGATADGPAATVPDEGQDTGTAGRGSIRLTPPLTAVEQEGLLIGEFPLARDRVIDGDTIRVEGIRGSVRLLSLDTEERFHGKTDRAAAAEDFESYLEQKRGDAARPVKAGTPMGQEAAKFAEAFFEGADSVRLERDDAKEIRGRHGRLLAYAFVQKKGRWISYNVECVRAGMSPYFTKYGYSNRFHNQFSLAEAEARKAKRGIWNPDARSYGDYDERKAWWNARADFIRAYKHASNRRDDYVQLTHWDAAKRLESGLGQEMTVLSTIDGIKHFKGLVRVSLAAQQGTTFPVIFFEKSVFQQTGIAHYQGEPVMVRGEVDRYEKGSYRTLQIVVENAAQISLPSLPPRREAPRAAR